MSDRIASQEPPVPGITADLAELGSVAWLRALVSSSAARRPPAPGGPGAAEESVLVPSPRAPEPPPRPEEPADRLGGRLNTKARLVHQFLLAALGTEDHLLASVLCRECRPAIAVSEEIFWRSAAELALEGAITKAGGQGTGRPTVLQRVPPTAAAPQNSGVS